jgi:hypothetical protein
LLLWQLRAINLIRFIRKYVDKSGRSTSAAELRNIFMAFCRLHRDLDVFGGGGIEGYQLLPSAGAAFFKADLKDARLSLRESMRATTEEQLDAQWKQSKNEEQWPARVGIQLPQDLQMDAGRTLALTAVYECHPTAVGRWSINDELGHWIAIVGKGNIPEAHSAALEGYDGIVLDSNRGYELWKLDGESGLRLNRPADPNDASDIRVWVYSLITIQMDETR